MKGEIIDIHVHYGAPKNDKNDCYWSPKFTTTPAYLAILLMSNSIFKKITVKKVEDHLFKNINGSKLVDKFVLLALDAVFDDQGVLHSKDWTHLYVSNDYIIKVCKENKRILFGASVHPFRPDWEDQLDYCIENGAVLCKWIPSSQQINPRDKRLKDFYRKLSDHNLPLLCHSGPEYTIPTSNDAYEEYDNPKYLDAALKAGVTVIVAHCAMPYFGLFDFDYQDDWQEFVKLCEQADKEKWNLYADLSAVCTPFREGYIRKIKEHSDVIPSGRLLFGSDFPVPLSELTYNKSTDFLSWIKYLLQVGKIKNPFDKNYEIIKGMGFNDKIFTNANNLFSQIKK
jgi:predicted TIM-barrel fold metal-dependent hydrolase